MGGILNSRLARAYKRWRHGRGFGIHSPFAYTLIVETLRDTLPYYKYDEVDGVGDKNLSAARLKTIFRMIVRFKPETVTISGVRGAEALRKAISLADSRIEFTDNSADMTVICADATRSVNQNSGVNIFLGDAVRCAACDEMWDGMNDGMRIDNSKDCTIIIRSSKFPHQRYDVKF